MAVIILKYIVMLQIAEITEDNIQMQSPGDFQIDLPIGGDGGATSSEEIQQRIRELASRESHVLFTSMRHFRQSKQSDWLVAQLDEALDNRSLQSIDVGFRVQSNIDYFEVHMTDSVSRDELPEQRAKICFQFNEIEQFLKPGVFGLRIASILFFLSIIN